ncbi:MAG TPA: tyrosine-type recombinase/integrase [Terracidiphilus sp.]
MISLRQCLDEYLALRRSLGYKLRKEGIRLPKFLTFLESRNADHILTAFAIDWATQSLRTARSERMTMVRGFARYMAAFDTRTEVPSDRLLPKTHIRPRPYIYSDDEIRRLMKAAFEYGHDRPHGTYYCLLGLLAVSGLRSGEALELRIEDIDLANRILTVHGAKFGKSRLVPIHSSTVKQLRAYMKRRDSLHAAELSPYLFVSRKGTRLCRRRAYYVFADLLATAGIRKQPSGRAPRLHDFRHRFAVQTLIDWYRAGQNVEQRLPTLSTFLGHVSVEDTYWYLTEYPELMNLAVQKLNRRWGKTL